MTERQVQMRLGIGALLAALFLGLYAIPAWVSSPSNVGNVVLSPLFWPYALAGLTGLTGFGLIFSGFRSDRDGAPLGEPDGEAGAAWVRLAAMAVIMGLTMLLLPRLGMVLTSMLVFVSTAFLVRTRHRITAVVCAVLVPLVLYAFFAHVAGVAIPQGDVLRLP
ncbi:tripartite tricarboxylate transporter TctB family protein [Roseobacter sinensis]|uniref:Tripartite tricarboxylate transporter TctB family protein n=1 Tax=Roseobacter sinensis TaxID=2931391 RepID=A0ABT3BHK2_9RHOB|nr:tripartite tricarboxylate transporter TctB family protein [Roseobacter sp. WL0113]MCV3273060.1 tripartite tricarboxylate transporter TctB family protein [Roseobacter sp. WL0113]